MKTNNISTTDVISDNMLHAHRYKLSEILSKTHIHAFRPNVILSPNDECNMLTARYSSKCIRCGKVISHVNSNNQIYKQEQAIKLKRNKMARQ